MGNMQCYVYVGLIFSLTSKLFFSVDQSYLLFGFLFYHVGHLYYRVFPLFEKKA